MGGHSSQSSNSSVEGTDSKATSPPPYRPLRSLPAPQLMTHIEEQPGLHWPLPAPCTVTCSIIYFGRQFMLSDTSITL